MSVSKAAGQAKVLAIGEVLWDVFGAERHLGGAPFNFACHCHALGAAAQIVTRVGSDALGREICERAEALGLSTRLVQRDVQHPTGIVDVTLDRAGVPSYVIREGVAWDYIELPEEAEKAAREADVVCFGSLAQRHEISRGAIRRALEASPKQALRIFDINLRQNYYSKPLLEESLELANVLKLNDGELQTLQEMFGLEASIERALEQLAERFGLETLVLTLGADGACAWSRGELARTPGIPVKVCDTVGSGDAFTAAFALGLAQGGKLAEVLRQANLAGAYVATQPGATPAMNAGVLERFGREREA